MAERKKEHKTDDKGRKLFRYEGDDLWQVKKEQE